MTDLIERLRQQETEAYQGDWVTKTTQFEAALRDAAPDLYNLAEEQQTQLRLLLRTARVYREAEYALLCAQNAGTDKYRDHAAAKNAGEALDKVLRDLEAVVGVGE